MDKNALLELIYDAVEEFNQMQEDDEQLPKSPDTVLFARAGFTKDGLLDSMGLVNFLVTLDDIMDTHQESVALNFDINAALEKKEEVLKDIGSLADYILDSNKR